MPKFPPRLPARRRKGAASNGVGDAVGTYGLGARRAQLGHGSRLRPDDDGIRRDEVGRACHSRESCGTTPAKAIASTASSERPYTF